MNKTTIINTRPATQAKNTQEIFQKAGFRVLNFPCVQIASVNNNAEIKQEMAKICANDAIVFTSQNAVSYAFKINPAWQIPHDCHVIAVGKKTALCLEQHINNAIWIPDIQNSEGVIELIKGLKKIETLFLITAKNGRNLIQNFAKDKNIELKQLNVYQRVLPKVENNRLLQLKKLQKMVILATSINALQNLQQLVPPSLLNHLQQQTLLCASNRIAVYAKEHGFQQTVNAQSANPKILLKFLLNQ